MELELARSLIAGTRAAAAREGMRPIAVVVLDAGGHVVAAEREDGASTQKFEIARAKANGAIAIGSGSRALMERAEKQPYLLAGLASAIVGGIVPVPGGVLVTDAEGRIRGAVGVSGDTSDHDEQAAVAGIEGSGLQARPA